jgi:TolA-binding protein
VPWSKRIAEGEFEIVLAEAEARGAESVLSSAGLGDVMALADAARYKGRQGLARRALESVRQRFGSSDAARTAAFLLGRMSEGAPAGAIAWYDTYLSEAPGGTFAAEALGRKMALLDRSGQRARARAVAEQYLASYPKGAYAALARQLRE